MTDLSPMPSYAFSLIRAIERMRDSGIDPAAVALPVMPGADPKDQPSTTIYGLPVLWVDSDAPVYVLVGLGPLNE